MNIRGFFTKKKIIWTVIIVVIVGGIAFRLLRPKSNASNISTDTAKTQNLKQTVLATGQVVSSTDLDLGFTGGGVIEQINVKEGDAVKQGQVLATLDQKNQQASVTSAQGQLAQAQANYQKVLDGASSEDVQVAQGAVDAAQVALTNAQTNLTNVQQQQATAVANAYSTLLNTSLSAVAASGNTGGATVTISGTYTGTQQGSYTVSVYATGSGNHFSVSGLETATGEVHSTPVPLGTMGLYIQFAGNPAANDSWTVMLPNTLSANYLTNANAYQTAVKAQSSAVATAQATVATAQTSLSQAKAALDFKKAQARPADIEAARAQILSAQGQVQAASAGLEDTVLRAPASGTITQIDNKVGEQATPLKEVMILQDVGNLHVEANVSEASIASVKPSQSVDFTFDALGPDSHFQGQVEAVNPASTVISGVVNYKVTATVENAASIKPGMTANMTILTAQKDNALAVPSSAIINQNNKQYVRVIDDPKKKTYHQIEVQTGLQADGGLVEVTSGLSNGQEIVTYIKP